MKGWLGIVTLGAVCFALALLLRTPAEFAYHYLGDRLPGRYFDLVGTVVKGHGRGITANRILLEDLRWSWRPAGLFKGRLEYGTKLRVGDGDLRARAALVWNGAYHLSELEGNLALAPLLPGLVPMAGGVNGWLRPDLEELRVQDGNIQSIRGQIRLQGLILEQDQPVPLGNFVAEAAGDGPPWQLGVRDDGGPLRLAGRLTLNANGAFQFEGLASARDDQAAVASVVNALGAADQNGQRRVRFSGRL